MRGDGAGKSVFQKLHACANDLRRRVFGRLYKKIPGKAKGAFPGMMPSSVLSEIFFGEELVRLFNDPKFVKDAHEYVRNGNAAQYHDDHIQCGNKVHLSM